MSTVEDTSEETDEAPLPNVDNFVEYFPWAVCQFSSLGINIVVRKVTESELRSSSIHSISVRKKSKLTTPEAKSKKSVRKISSDTSLDSEANTPTITLTAKYSKGGVNLIGLQFEKSIIIPRAMLYVLGLIIRFHLKLQTVNFVGNADQYIVYELSKIIQLSNITEVTLDGSYVKEGNFHILLDEKCNLRILSLARCSINDTVLKLMMDKIVFPKPAGFSLKILNLSSNRITDIGAKYVADTLRLNRHLYHLNLAGNSITEDGADEILNIFLDFPTTEDELLYTRQSYYKYLQEKHKLVHEFVCGESANKVNNLSKIKASTISLEESANKVNNLSKIKASTSSPLESENKLNHLSKIKTSTISLLEMKKKKKKRVKLNIAQSKLVYDDLMRSVTKATDKARLTLGMFDNPLSGEVTKDGVVYCAGNNTLRCLNLAYNSLSFNNLKKLLQVLRYQKSLDRKPIGLINVNIEGNRIPVACTELREIDDLLILAADLQPSFLRSRLFKSPSRSSRLTVSGRTMSSRRLKNIS